MANIVYIDAVNGTDVLNGGGFLTPFKTIEYFCNTIALKNNTDYEVRLNNGTYEITTDTIFGQFQSGTMDIVGLGENTEIIQKTGMYVNSIGGSQNFTLNMKKLKYNILTTLTGSNLIGFYWSWNFYNVIFEYTPNNGYSVFNTANSAKGMTFKNCVKLTSTNNFLRKNSSTISIYDSMGYFTSGYQTSQSDWDKSGNTIGSIGDYQQVLRSGLYSWKDDDVWKNYKSILKSNNKVYSIESDEKEYSLKMTSNNSPTPYVASASSVYSSSFPAYLAFNGTTTTSNDAWVGANNMRTGWIQIDFGANNHIVANKVILRGRYSEDGVTTYNPKDFQILGSNDNVTFDVLGEYTNQTDWKSQEERIFYFKNKKEYRYYRINILNHNGHSYVSIGNILYGYENPTLIELDNESTNTFIKYGFDTVRVNYLFENKKYILQDDVSENTDGLWVQEIDRKPLSIKFE